MAKLGITSENLADQIVRLAAAEKELDDGQKRALVNAQQFETASRDTAESMRLQEEATKRLNAADIAIQETAEKRLQGLKALDRALPSASP